MSVDQLNALAALPLHALLLAGMIIEGWVIRLLWMQNKVIQERLDDCLGSTKPK